MYSRRVPMDQIRENTAVSQTRSDSTENAQHVGRFAPSPTGKLHFGSLVTALASYVSSRAQKGLWRVRMDDLDRARVVAGSDSDILRILELCHLHWDGAVVYQSANHDIYRQGVERLLATNHLFYCGCSRKDVSLKAGHHDNHCSQRPVRSIRCASSGKVSWNDCWQGMYVFDLDKTGAFPVAQYDVSRTTDTIQADQWYNDSVRFSYHLASVLDDDEMKVTQVIRGADLMESTARQMYLCQMLALRAIEYRHLATAINDQGQKLSKQTLARPVPFDQVGDWLFAALGYLGQNPEAALRHASTAEQVSWAVDNWQESQIPKMRELVIQQEYQ